MSVRLLALAVLFTAEVALADDEACVANHASAQELRKSSRLIEARDKLIACAERTCPQLVQADCANWLEQVERDLPSVVVSATDSQGRELSEVRVLIDGEEVAKRLDGKPIDVDPGDYSFRLVRADGSFVDREVVAKTGEKNAPVRVVFEKPGARAGVDSATSSPDRTWVWVFGGVSGVGLGSFAYFAIKGQSDYDRLQKGCAPSCARSDSDAVKQKFLIADVSLGIGLVAAAAATYFYLSPPNKNKNAIGIRAQLRPHCAFVGVSLGL